MKICLTGADGAGKSTIIHSLAKQLDAKKTSYSICSIWDTMSFFHQFFDAKATPESIQKYLMSCDKRSRIYFLLHSLSYSYNIALKKNTDLVLIDSYWYKYVLSEADNEDELAQLTKLCDVFEQPDIVFYLKLPIDTAINRKKNVGFSSYELRGKTPEEGINFFKSNFLKMENMFSKIQNKNWIELDALNSVDELTQTILSNIVKS